MIDLGRCGIGKFGRRLVVALDDKIDFATVNPVLLAINVWQAVGDFDDHDLGAFDNGSMPKTRSAEIEIPVGIQGAGLQDRDVDRSDVATVIIRNFTEIDGNIMAYAGVVLCAVISGKMPAEPKEMRPFALCFCALVLFIPISINVFTQRRARLISSFSTISTK